MLSSYKEYNFGLYAVIHQKSQQLIGFCGLLLWSFEEQPEIEIGYRLARDYWGQGLGTEAARAVKDYAWNNWGFNRLICIIQPENTRSIRVAEKIGMHYERDTIFMDLDVNIYSIDKKKFPTN
jgi:RimJ/RimL family protein N-acetyltransferase